MKAYKVTVLIVDHDQLGSEGVKENLEAARFANDCIDPKVIEIDEHEIGTWSDDHPLNKRGTDVLEYLRENTPTIRENPVVRRLRAVCPEISISPDLLKLSFEGHVGTIDKNSLTASCSCGSTWDEHEPGFGRISLLRVQLAAHLENIVLNSRKVSQSQA